MLISVIIPVYNVAEYLEKCVKSVTGQTFKNLEIILVNDGSTDGSDQICESLAERDSRIHYISQKNGGLSAARNAGLEVMTGDYCLFVDSDDFLSENALEILSQQMEDYDAVIFNYSKVDAQGEIMKKSLFYPGRFSFHTEKERFDYLFQYFFFCRHGWEAWNRLYSGPLIRRHHLRFYDNRMILAEDMEFNLRYISYVRKIKVIEDNLYRYVPRENSLMGLSRHVNNLPRFNRLSMEIFRFVKAQKLNYWKSHYYLIHMGILRLTLYQIKENNPDDMKTYMNDFSRKELDFYKKQWKNYLRHPRKACHNFKTDSYFLAFCALIGSFRPYFILRGFARKMLHH